MKQFLIDIIALIYCASCIVLNFYMFYWAKKLNDIFPMFEAGRGLTGLFALIVLIGILCAGYLK